MAHALDAKLRIPVTANTTTTDNPATASFTCGAGCTVLVMGIIVGSATASRTGGAPTYNGVALTQAGITRTSAETKVECWYLLDPPTGSALTVSIPNAGWLSLDICVVSFKAQSGYKSLLDVATGSTDIGVSPSYSVTTTANGDAIFAICGSGANAWEPTAHSGVQIYDNDNGGWGGGSQYALQATAGASPMSWTFAVSDDWAIAIASFKEVAVPTTSLQVVWSILEEKSVTASWDVKNEAPLASGWGIVKEISIGFAWKTIAEQSAQTGWNLLVTQEQDLTWNILGITYASVSASWRVIAESVKDISWSTLSQQSIPSSWAITAERSISSSWSVINAGQILVDLSWNIIAETGQQSAWAVLKQTSAPTISWAVLCDNSLGAAWRILVEQSKSSGWGILREASKGSSWAVFGESSALCSWLIVNERTTYSQWVILDNTKLSIPLSWAILDTTKAVSSLDWSILGTNSVSQSWRILTDFAVSDTWYVLAQSSLPTAWGIINTTDLSRQLAWGILAQDGFNSDWQVFNSSRLSSSWGVLTEDPYTMSWRDMAEIMGGISWRMAWETTEPESIGIDFASLLPPSIAYDPGVMAAAGGSSTAFTDTRNLIPEAVLYARIDELSSEALDHIAWGFHIDGWEFAETIERKRAFVKLFFDFHRYKGTAYGLRLYWRALINRLVLKIDPPGKSFLGVSMTQEERERFEGVHPEVRVYPFRHSGAKGSFFCGDCTGDPREDYGVYPARTEALLRIGDRVTVYDPQLDEETEINRFEYDTEYVTQKATDTIEIRKPGNESAGGIFLGRYLEGETVDTGADQRLYSLTLDREYTTELERRTPLSIQPSLTPFRTTYETETEDGIAVGIHLGNRYPDDYPETGGSCIGQHFPVASNASERIYRKLRLFDPDRVPGTMSTGRMTYLGAFRVGQQLPHTARVAVDMQGKRIPGAQFLSGYLRGRHLCTSDAETRIEQMRYVGKMAKRASDKVLISIRNRYEITTSSGLLTGTKKCGQIELEVI